jgi:hypothetical protein
MTNLATLIGAKNYCLLLNDKNNTHVLIKTEDLIKFEVLKINDYFNDAKVVGVGTEHSCNQLLTYLQKL